jgi:hypothetical protein
MFVAYHIQNYNFLSGRQATAACVYQLAGYKFSPQKQQYFFAHVKALTAPWFAVLLTKLTVARLIMQSPAFYGTRRFTTAYQLSRS